jgi:hypothetical protein
MLTKLLRFLGSINLALLLLAVLIVASVIGTLCEKGFSTEVAQAYVYGSWWFTFWLLLLTVNLICAAAVRFPWQRYQYAFVVTHAGIVIILFGGLIDRHWGVEGNVRLIEGAPPVTRMNVAGEELLVEVDGTTGTARTPFAMSLLKQRASVALRATSPADDVRVDIVDLKPVIYTTSDAEPMEGGWPALKWGIKSSMTGPQGSWLFPGEGVEMGPAVIRFVQGKMEPYEAAMASLDFSLDASGQLHYRRYSKSGTTEGAIQIGKEEPLSWGPGSVFVVEKFLPSARPCVTWSTSNNKQAQPGLRCRVEAGGENTLVWLGPTMAPPISPWQDVRVGGKTVRLSFGQRTRELPFSLQLVKFDAPYHEGLESMGRFAKFESLLRFDAQAGSEQTASMNNPATYPHTWWGPILGTSYRISQSGHEKPARPDVSIVQVLRDPGWCPKWFGSLLVCGGIFWMFYLRRPGTQAPVKSDAS